MDIPIAANILGTAGAICWSIQLIPQIIINARKRDTTGLQPSMMLLWAAAGVPLGVYNIVEDFNIALRIQPQILTVLSLVTWCQCCFFSKHWSILKCFYNAFAIAGVMAGIQTGLIFALKIAKEREVKWPLILMAVLSASLLGAGVLRHYWDIYVHRTVRGISFIFVGIDAAGDLFSLVAIFFEKRLDPQGMAIYGSELILWIGVFICGAFFNLPSWIQKRKNRREQSGYQEEPPNGGISLHRISSSTSVFRTASGGDVVSRRSGGHREDGGD